MNARPAEIPYDVARIRADFPVLSTTTRGKRLAFLDSAASAQRPLAVIEAVDRYERTSHANVHRGVYQLSQKATDAFEGARERVRRFINAASLKEVIFTRGATESINLVAQSWGQRLGPSDEILITWMEHHANIVPWQMLCERTGATLKVAPINRRGELDIEAFRALLSPHTKLVAFTQVSNVLGTVLPIKDMIAAARSVGALTLLDGAQAVAHQRVDMQALGCDFYVFSSHKLYGPTGIGVLWAREAILREMPPWQGGGDMILTVRFSGTTYNELPYRFEAGTPNISGAVGLAAAMDYLDSLGIERAHTHEQRLLALATVACHSIDGLQIIGEAKEKSGVISFVVEGVHAHDLGTILDDEGVAVRTGHHCAMPLMEFFGVPATLRVSFGCYSNDEDIDQLVRALGRAREVFG
ncbi:MAG: cysteine desulfurase [Gammaproteobacteria bacterium]|nr:cysteine desulfurase [Gammaproteobacteria bacterium]